MWLYPAPTQSELDAYYNGAYRVDRDQHLRRVIEEGPAVGRWISRARRDPGRMLEIGCSYGGMLAAFRSHGWDVEGVELDARAAEWARDQLGLSVWSGHLEECLADLRPPYDIVALYHVIEHVTDPAAFARQLKTLCGDQGTVLIKTPNAASVIAHLTGGWWQWAAAPEHVQVYSPTSIRTLLANAGLPVFYCETRIGDADHAAFELLRAGAKRFVGDGNPAGGDRSTASRSPLHTRRWFAATRALVNVLGAPLDGVIAGGIAAGCPWGAELVILAGGSATTQPAAPSPNV